MSPRAAHRVAVIGAGIGAEHVQGYRALPRNFAVSVICDLDPARAARLAERCGAAVSDDMDAVLSDPEIEIVDICLPPRMHAPVTLKALAAGKHVIVEKPLAGSLAEVDQIAAAAQAAGRHVFPVFQYRYGPAMRALKRLHRHALLGPLKVATLETHWDRKPDYYDIRWRGTRAHEMGGVIVSHAIHIHDLLCELGGPVAEVSAALTTAINRIETEDCAALWMRLQNGALVTSSVTLGAARDESRLRLVYEKATVESGRAPYTPCKTEWTVTARDPQDEPAITAALEEAALTPGTRHTGFAGFFEAIARSLADGTGAAWLGAGRRSVELASAVYLSAATHRAVTLPLDPSLPVYADWSAV